MAPEEFHPDITLDLRDLRCPHLLISVIHALQRATPGQIIRVRAAELNAPSSIGAWTRQSGNTLLDLYQEEDEFVFYIRHESVAVSLATNG